MIAYSLSCARGHEFEGWFKDSASFDSQAAEGVLICPMCGDSKIGKAIMAPSVVRTDGSPSPRNNTQTLRQYAAGLREFIHDNAEYVGARFADEARKIHYGEADERHIYGESTVSEVRELIEEGIDVAPFPADPDDMN